MARYTNLYQAPRSPLIQGRTRWERPLWQAWLGGIAIAAALLTTVMFIRTTSRHFVFVFDAAMMWLLVGVVVGGALGVFLGRLWGWRRRWIASALMALMVGSFAYALHGFLFRGWTL